MNRQVLFDVGNFKGRRYEKCLGSMYLWWASMTNNAVTLGLGVLRRGHGDTHLNIVAKLVVLKFHAHSNHAACHSSEVHLHRGGAMMNLYKMPMLYIHDEKFGNVWISPNPNLWWFVPSLHRTSDSVSFHPHKCCMNTVVFWLYAVCFSKKRVGKSK